MGQWLTHSVDLLRARPKAIAAVLIIVCGLAAIGAMRLEVETDFTRNFRPGSSIVESYAFVETHLGGAGVWDVVVPAPATLDKEYLDRVRRLEQRLRAIEAPIPARSAREGHSNSSRASEVPSHPALTKVISLVDAIDAIETDKTLAALTPSAEIRAQGLAAAMPVFLGALRKTELDEQGYGRLRIMLRAPERQPAEQKRRLIEEVARIAREEFPPDQQAGVPGAEVTGFFVLLTNLIESMLRDQWTTFAIASGSIALLVLIGFRSWKYALIGLVPNAVPIYVVMGLMGWLNLTGLADLKINMGSAMIAAVSMGMSIDSSIHYFAAFRRARRAGRSVHAALYEVQQSVGSAMIFSTIALVMGFGVLITSDFVPTIYFGALMCLAMMGGMLGNLIVLPLLLSWTERDHA